MAISEALLPEFDEEMANTRKVLERVPDDKLDYKPHEKSMSFGQLATHVAEIPGWVKDMIEKELLEMDASYTPFLAKSRQEMLEVFDKGVKESRELISNTSDADLLKTWTFKYDGKEIVSMPRAAVLRSMVMNHIIHHRAQLGVYLRLNDIAVPGMYGPSADEMEAFKVKSA